MAEPIAYEALKSYLVPLWVYRTQNFLFFVVCALYFWNQYQIKKALKKLKEKKSERPAAGREPMAARN